MHRYKGLMCLAQLQDPRPTFKPRNTPIKRTGTNCPHNKLVSIRWKQLCVQRRLRSNDTNSDDSVFEKTGFALLACRHLSSIGRCVSVLTTGASLLELASLVACRVVDGK